MKIKINGRLWGLILIFLSISGTAQAVDPVRDTARVVNTSQVVALGLSVSEGPSGDTLLVDVFSPRVIEMARQARFSWYDSAGVPVGSYTTGMAEADFLGLRKIRIPKLEFVGSYRLQTDVFSPGGSLLGTGTTLVDIDSGSERLELSAPTLVREPDGFSLGYNVTNYNLTQEVVPRLQGFYLKDGERQYVLQRKLDPIRLTSRQRAAVDFTVEEEFPSGEYYLETWIESTSGRYLSGVMESYMQMPGSYARLVDLSVDFNSLSPDQAEVLLEGFALVPQERDLQVRLSSEYDGAVLSQEVVSVPVVDGYFVEKFRLEFPKKVPFFSGTVDLFSGNGFELGDSLLTQSFSSPVVSLGSANQVATSTEKSSKVQDSEAVKPLPWWQLNIMVWGGVSLAVLIVAWLIWRLVRRRSNRVF